MDKKVVPTGDVGITKPEHVSRQKVTVLSAKGPTSLVVWENDEGQQRAFLPSASIIDGKAEEVELARAQPYGESWAKIIAAFGNQVLQEHASALQAAMRRHGIWTYEQLDKRPRSYAIALNDVFSVRTALEAGRKKR